MSWFSDDFLLLQMEGRFAEEIYGESSLHSKIEVKSVSAEDQEDNLNGKTL